MWLLIHQEDYHDVLWLLVFLSVVSIFEIFFLGTLESIYQLKKDLLNHCPLNDQNQALVTITFGISSQIATLLFLQWHGHYYIFAMCYVFVIWLIYWICICLKIFLED